MSDNVPQTPRPAADLLTGLAKPAKRGRDDASDDAGDASPAKKLGEITASNDTLPPTLPAAAANDAFIVTTLDGVSTSPTTTTTTTTTATAADTAAATAATTAATTTTATASVATTAAAATITTATASVATSVATTVDGVLTTTATAAGAVSTTTTATNTTTDSVPTANTVPNIHSLTMAQHPDVDLRRIEGIVRFVSKPDHTKKPKPYRESRNMMVLVTVRADNGEKFEAWIQLPVPHLLHDEIFHRGLNKLPGDLAEFAKLGSLLHGKDLVSYLDEVRSAMTDLDQVISNDCHNLAAIIIIFLCFSKHITFGLLLELFKQDAYWADFNDEFVPDGQYMYSATMLATILAVAMVTVDPGMLAQAVTDAEDCGDFKPPKQPEMVLHQLACGFRTPVMRVKCMIAGMVFKGNRGPR